VRTITRNLAAFLCCPSLFPNLNCGEVAVHHAEVITMSQLILSCAKTGRAFKSDFRVTSIDLRHVPPKWKATLLCAICHHVHEFNFAEARVCERPDDCSRQYGECQNCEFANRVAAA
jgi:hypothetical protein